MSSSTKRRTSHSVMMSEFVANDEECFWKNCLTMIHKDIFNISLCHKHEWRSGKDRHTTLGRGRVLWIKAVTVTGQRVDLVNVYKHTSRYPQKQQRLQATLTKALTSIKDPCMFFGDFNASTCGGRVNYAPAHTNNPTTIADQAFAEFIEATNGTVIPPARSTWKAHLEGLTVRKLNSTLALSTIYRKSSPKLRSTG
jgi:endonuclease/exonuclease/phosphatase (EEP) superfamily protein YafD